MSSVHFLLGKTLGKYQILEHLGHGGMSEVYKGQQAQLDRLVAIKVLHPFLADEEGFVVRFQREARIVATLRHPNIVQVYDFDYHEDLAIYYMVMEYIDGPTLKDLLDKHPLSPLETVRMGAAIADALDYAHQRSMVHRDIKPANIMFIEDQQPVLTDFGIAKMLTLSGLTASGAMVGTPAYMAPEVGIGKAGTALSDLYSLGVVLFQAVTGRLPFDAETPMGMVMQHINDPPPPPSRFAPDLPEPVEKVIMRALAKRPEARFASGGDMALELRRAIGLDLANDTPPFLPRVDISALLHEADIPAKVSVRETGGGEPALEAPPDDAPTEEDRLLRSWTTLSHQEVADAPDGVAATADAPDELPLGRPRFGQRALRVALMFVIFLIGGSVIWFGASGGMPDALRAMLRLEPAEAVPAAATALNAKDLSNSTLPMALGTPTPEPTLPPSPTPEVSPTEQAVCHPQVRLTRARIEPNATVGPGSDVIAYVTIHNNGDCTWPRGGTLQIASGETLGAPETFTVKSLAPDESVQVLIPMQAPEEPGTYLARWEMRTPAGDTVGSRLPVQITVSATADATPTPVPPPAPDTPSPEPLTMMDPTLLTWQDDPARSRWTGTVRVNAAGGTGRYDFYQTEVRGNTQLQDGMVTFEWRRCESVPLNLWVLSGDQTLNWQGEIPYPNEETCK